MSRAGVQLSVCLDVQIPGFNPTPGKKRQQVLCMFVGIYIYNTLPPSQKSIWEGKGIPIEGF